MTGGLDLSQNPYIGPNPYPDVNAVKDIHRYFFGRDEEIAVLRGLVLVRRATLLFAQSGAGKSSLLNAGLVPALTGQRKDDPEPIMRVVMPSASVGAAIPVDVPPTEVANAFVLSVLLSLPHRSTDDHRSLARKNLVEGLSDLVKPGDQDRTLTLDTLLIIDQFEELFTRHNDRLQDREDFFKQVRIALQEHPNLRVLFSMREDYIAELTPYVGLLPDQLRSRFRLERLKKRAALDAVRLPAREAGREFLEGAAEELVERLCRGQSTQQITPTTTGTLPTPANDGGLYVEPVHLQVVCHKLWSKLPPERTTIGIEDVRRLGDIYEALASFYEDAVRQAATKIDGREMLVRYWFEREVITPARSRGLVFQDRRTSTVGSLPNDAVDVLNRAYVVRTLLRGDDTWYELAHDRLIEPVLQANQIWWLKQPRLVQAAKAWDDSGRSTLPTIDRSLENQIRQASSGPLDSPVKDFVTMARAGTTDEAQRDRLLERDLSETGWGIIFARDADPAMAAALSELLAHRKDRAKSRFRVFSGKEDGYQPGESAAQFLERHETKAGPAGADSIPYYLLVVGSPTIIPFEFQYYLGVNQAVGRIAFDSWQEYADYARSVVATETGQVVLPRRAVLFAPRNPDDTAINYSHERLVTPLFQELRASGQDWDFSLMTENLAQDQASDLMAEKPAHKEGLKQLLETGPAWSVLFAATHGMPFREKDGLQRENAGALVCQDWPGPTAWNNDTPLSPKFYFSASDLDDLSHPRLLGSIAFLFGEFTAGTPPLDSFAPRWNALYGGQNTQPRQFPPEPFIAQLPQRMLGYPKGGALAVIGHVDVNWTTSFVGRSRRGQSSIGAFVFLLSHLMKGYPVGFAMEEFRRRFRRELSGWAEMRMQVDTGEQTDPTAYATQVTAMIDLRNFIILGDPAVRLMVAEPGDASTVQQPVLTPSSLGMPMLKLHPKAVTSLSWRSNGAYLLTVCGDGAARVWPEGAGAPWIISADQGDEIQVAAWRSDGLRVATLSRQGVLTTWDVGALPGGGIGPAVRVGDRADLLVWQPNGTTLAVVHGRDLLLYNSDTGALLQTLTGHTGLIRSCAWSPDGLRLATTCRDAVLRVWGTQAGTLLKALAVKDHQEKLGIVSWSPDGRFLAYSTELQPSPQDVPDAQPAAITSVIRVLDASSFALVHELRGHLGAVRVMSWRPSGDLLASISNDKAIVWDTLLGKQKFMVERRSLQIIDTAYSPDGRKLWSTGDDRIVRLWEAESGTEFQQIAGHNDQVTCVVWHPNSSSVAIGRSDGVVVIVPKEESVLQIVTQERI